MDPEALEVPVSLPAQPPAIPGVVAPPRYQIALGFPGTSFKFLAAHAAFQASFYHDVHLIPAGAAAGNFDVCWATALNDFEKGAATHFAMLHADTFPPIGWLDVMIAEMEALKASLLSVAIAIKDNRGLMSCGVGDFNDPWVPYRRVTATEMEEKLPETFGLAELKAAGFPEGYLLHNNGCWVADLRNKEFFSVNDNGELRCVFNFPRRIVRNGEGAWATQGESEDWYFSRVVHHVGLRNTYITRKIKLLHRGEVDYPNHGKWGQFEVDEHTAHKWRVNGHHASALVGKE